MLLKFLLSSLRNLLNNKLYSSINILGLSIGFAAALLIFAYVGFELSYDHVYQGSGLYSLRHIVKTPSSENNLKTTYYNLGPAFKDGLPEVSDFARSVSYVYINKPFVSLPGTDKFIKENNVVAADSNWFELLELNFIYGNRRSALFDRNSVVITQSTAKKYFGKEEVLGEKLHFKQEYYEGDYVITGVVEDKKNNSFVADITMPIRNFFINSNNIEWHRFEFFTTVVRMNNNPDLKTVEAKMNAVFSNLLDKSAKDDVLEIPYVEPLSEFHFNAETSNNSSFNLAFTGNRDILYLFALIGASLLAISWVNFINIETARSIKRATEVGIRKVVGATRVKLIFQFLIGAFIVNVIAINGAILFFYLFFPLFRIFTGSHADFGILSNPIIIILLFGFVLVSTVVSGFYPAIILSGYQPVRVLGGNFGTSSNGSTLRKTLVVVQFIVTFLLIGGVYASMRQIFFLKNIEIGADIHQRLVIPNPVSDGPGGAQTFHQIKSKFESLSEVDRVCSTFKYPGMPDSHPFTYVAKANPDMSVFLEYMKVSRDYFDVYEIELLAGKNFAEGPEKTLDIILSESSVEKLGFPNKESAIGQVVINAMGGSEYTIIGVVKDYYHFGTKSEMTSILYYKSDIGHQIGWMFTTVKLNGPITPESIAKLDKAWKDINPNYPMDYIVLDDVYSNLFSKEFQLVGVIGFFAFLAIIISCLGLFGLSSYNTYINMKQIAIRKILGSEVISIIVLFVKSYVKLLGISIIIAFPLMLSGLNRWLQIYPNRVELGIDIFLIPVITMVIVVIFTVSYETYKISTTNPGRVIRHQ